MDQQPPAAPQTPAPQPGQYDFFMNTPEPQKKPLFSGGVSSGGGGSKKRLIFAGIGGLVVVIILFMLVSSLFSGNKQRGSEILVMAQQQAEIIRTAGLSKNEPAARGVATQTLAANTSITVQSSHEQVLGLLKKYKVKADDKKLALLKKESTDKNFAAAADNNTYDEVFKETMSAQLKTYQATAKKLFNTSKSQSEKQILAEAYDGATLLLGEQTQQ
ncbi:hypothetical protein EKI60_04105 [Candidatus Saccharibacteria bacterium]|nr:MAG: hypothetical protein EKI60_04105 [Candidatus Saccharibacteria bacterium]